MSMWRMKYVSGGRAYECVLDQQSILDSISRLVPAGAVIILVEEVR